jgi:hypothetical protein
MQVLYLPEVNYVVPQCRKQNSHSTADVCSTIMNSIVLKTNVERLYLTNINEMYCKSLAKYFMPRQNPLVLLSCVISYELLKHQPNGIFNSAVIAQNEKTSQLFMNVILYEEIFIENGVDRHI